MQTPCPLLAMLTHFPVVPLYSPLPPRPNVTLLRFPVALHVFVSRVLRRNNHLRSSSPSTFARINPTFRSSTRCAPRPGCGSWWLKVAHCRHKDRSAIIVSDALLIPATNPASTLKPTTLVDSPSENSTTFRRDWDFSFCGLLERRLAFRFPENNSST